MKNEKEYEALREEILQNQGRRLTVASLSVVVVTAMLGWAITDPDKCSGEAVSTLLLAFLTAACCLTFMFGRSNAKIGTYIQIFHENTPLGPGWEGRGMTFDKRASRLNLNNALSLLYLGLAAMSLVIPLLQCSGTVKHYPLLVFIGLIFVVTLSGVAFFSYPRTKYISYWEHIKKEEQDSQTDDDNDPNPLDAAVD